MNLYFLLWPLRRSSLAGVGCIEPHGLGLFVFMVAHRRHPRHPGEAFVTLSSFRRYLRVGLDWRSGSRGEASLDYTETRAPR